MPKNKRTIPDRKLLIICGCLALLSLVLYPSGKPTSQATASQTNPPPSRTPQERLLYHNNIGIALLEQFSFREALAEFAECLKVDAKFVPALVNSGLAHFYLQEFSQAEEYFKKSVALDPSQPNALFALGMIHRNQNQMDLGLESFQKILASDPQDVTTLYQAGQIYLKRQDYAQAVTTLQKVVELSPYDIAAHYNLATALIRKGDQAEGQKVMETFTRLREKGGISSTGTQYGEQGKYMLAIGEYPDIKGLVDENAPIPVRSVGFVDATPESGIRFQHGASGQSEIAGAAPKGGGFDCVNGIGRSLLGLRQRRRSRPLSGQQLVRPAKSKGVLYRNVGKGQFEDVAEKAGIEAGGLTMGVYWGDFNNDGKADLFVTQYGANRLFQNNGDGTFSDVSSRAGFADDRHWHLSAAVADVDHDGDLDIYVGNYVDPKQVVALEAGKSDGVDFSKLSGGSCHLYRNNGDGTFTDVAEEAKVKVPSEIITSVVFTDFDNRRDIDFWVVSQNRGSHLYSNQRVGTFRDLAANSPAFPSLTQTASATVGDYNKDGWPDFALVSNTGETTLVANLGNGRFQAEAPLSPPVHMRDAPSGGMAQFFDYDNDSDLDLFVLRGGKDSSSSKEVGPELWENQNGKFVFVDRKGRARQVPRQTLP